MSVQPKLNIRWHILLDKFTGLTRMMMDSQNIWSQFQMYKAKAIEIALSHHPDTLFLDSDTIIFQPIYLQKGDYKLGVSPQFITQTHIDNPHTGAASKLVKLRKAATRVKLQKVTNWATSSEKSPNRKTAKGPHMSNTPKSNRVE